jgi:hypothetical protein
MDNANNLNLNQALQPNYSGYKRISLIIDYYTNSLIYNLKSKNEISNKLRLKFIRPEKYLDMSTKEKREFYEYTPWGLAYMSIYNFLPILKKKMFYTPEIMRDVMFNLFKLDISVLKENIMSVYKLFYNTFKSIAKINLSPASFINHSLLYYLGFLNFLKTNHINQGLNNKDYINLFFISGMGSIPIMNFLQNFYLKKYVVEEKVTSRNIIKMYTTPHQKFHLVCVKSIMDNFVLFAAYFNLVNFFAVKEKEVKNLTQRENYHLFKEMINSNETFKRVEVLYMKDEPLLEKYDITVPILYTTFILGIIYTPIDYLLNTLINNNLSLKQYFKALSSDVSHENVLLSRQNMFFRLRYSLWMNIIGLFMKYGIVLNNYDDYFNSKE